MRCARLLRLRRSIIFLQYLFNIVDRKKTFRYQIDHRRMSAPTFGDVAELPVSGKAKLVRTRRDVTTVWDESSMQTISRCCSNLVKDQNEHYSNSDSDLYGACHYCYLPRYDIFMRQHQSAILRWNEGMHFERRIMGTLPQRRQYSALPKFEQNWSDAIMRNLQDIRLLIGDYRRAKAIYVII